MALPSFLGFTPVPLKSRHDGWSPDLQMRFIVALARGAAVGEAARSVGKNRQTAYALRKRPGAESFAAAWDAALEFARRMRLLPAQEAPAAAAPAVAPHGGKGVESDKSDKADACLSGRTNFLNLLRPTVALRPATLRRPPC